MPDRQSGYVQISNYLPSLAIEPDSSDLFYQISRPRPSGTEIAGLRINRLSKWSVARLGVFNIQLGPVANLSTEVRVNDESHAINAELDISTDPNSQSDLPTDGLTAVFRELVAFGSEILERGDIP